MNTTRTKSRLLGIHLLTASALTLLWALICPTYTPWGSSRFETQYRHTDGNLIDRDYYTLDFGRFFAGEVVIWSAVFGVYFSIRRDNAQPSDAPNER
jgi:hypothetical protein